MRSPRTIRAYEIVERVFGRGQLLWFGVRKRWMRDVVEQSIEQGARQLLVVGAGFDPLAALVARAHPDVLCVEIDAPPTAEAKRKGIEGAGLVGSNHVVVPADLARTSIEDALRGTGWRGDVRSVVTAEGLLMYLRPENVAGFFSQVRRSSFRRRGGASGCREAAWFNNLGTALRDDITSGLNAGTACDRCRSDRAGEALRCDGAAMSTGVRPSVRARAGTAACSQPA